MTARGRFATGNRLRRAALRLFRFLCWSLLCGLGGQLSACAGHSSEPLLAELDIPFLTTRRVEIQSDGDIEYSTDTGDLSAGRCTVTLRGEELDAENGEVAGLPVDQALEHFATRSKTGLLVYIHGYNISLNRACRDAARLAHATGFEDRLLLFSWPASRTVVTYRRDEARLAESVPAMLGAIRTLGARYGFEHINIVTHSMGSRLVLAMAEQAAAAETPGGQPINNLILVAPDVDRERFQAAAPLLRPRAKNISVLVSEDDKLLFLSELLNRNERLGQDSDFVVPGVRVVDVSDIEDLGPTGHIYHLENDRVGELLRYILSADDNPPPR